MDEKIEICIKRAFDLHDTQIIDNFEIGTYKGLAQIHHYLFQESFNFAGEMRTVNISKGTFKFASVYFLEKNLILIDKMSEETFEDIIDKYTEMNIAHPFREGNGRATRIWLNSMLKRSLNTCINWSLVNKNHI